MFWDTSYNLSMVLNCLLLNELYQYILIETGISLEAEVQEKRQEQ